MELWIRSQSRKTLVRCTNVVMQEYFGGDVDIRTLLLDGGDILLGRYTTNERAKEILDEIQKILSYRIIQSKPLNTNDMLSDNQIIMNSCNTEIHDIGSYVFEMPQE